MKLAHLQLKDGMGNKATLVCRLDEGSINYIFYGGWMDQGLPYSLRNLQCTLPIEKASTDETKEQFVSRLIRTINKDSVYKVEHEVSIEIKF